MGGEVTLTYVERNLGVRGLADMTPQALLAMVAARDAAQLCLALFGVYAILRAPLTSIGLRLSNIRWLTFAAVIGLATALIFPRLVQELRFQNSYNFQYMIYIMSRATGLIAAASILVYIFFVPIVEEIVFRGIVLKGLTKVTNDVIAVIVSAAIFSGIHATGGIALMVPAFLSGLFYGWLYLRTRSTAPSSVAHIIYNAVVFYPLIVYMARANRF
jgi:membrane protease YdiL (CAAX protease family)